MLAEAATSVPALTPLIEKKCYSYSYGERPAPVFFQIDSGERRNIECSSGVQQKGAPWAGRCSACRLAGSKLLKRSREEFEPQGVRAFAYLDDISLGMLRDHPEHCEGRALSRARPVRSMYYCCATVILSLTPR